MVSLIHGEGFTFLLLLQNPRTYQAAQAEVDRVLGNDAITPKHASQLPYIFAVLRER
jgi:cytochrome P450 / NADPH-cytochrome P450 reductase